MTKTNNFIFKGLNIIAWIIFVGLCIEAGALIFNFIYSIYKPQIVGHLYQKLDLSQVYYKSQWVYFGIYSFIITLSLLKAYLFYIVIQLTSELNLIKPFTIKVLNQINKISYYTFSIGIVSYIAKITTQNLQHKGYVAQNIDQFWVDSRAFIVMAAIIYVIAIIFDKGIQLQAETDLTI